MILLINVLTIRNEKDHSLKSRLLSLLRPYRIETQVKSIDDICIFDITYTRRRSKGSVRYDRIYRLCAGKSKVILCSRDTEPVSTPLRRFESLSLQRCLMTNYICDILSKSGISPAGLHISYYDPRGEYPGIAEKLLKYCSALTIVTDMPRFYENEAERISAGSDTDIIVSNEPDDIYPCDMIVAPEVIKRPISAALSTLVFTVGQPASTVTGNVIYKYNARLPERYKALMPEGIDEIYFMSGLYELGRQIKLAEIIPSGCGNRDQEFDNEMIIRQLKAGCGFDKV